MTHPLDRLGKKAHHIVALDTGHDWIASPRRIAQQALQRTMDAPLQEPEDEPQENDERQAHAHERIEGHIEGTGDRVLRWHSRLDLPDLPGRKGAERRRHERKGETREQERTREAYNR
jgi:hypothetical protein